jgi:hypothetical protein
VPLESLTKVNKNHLTTPHRTNFYHIFLLENCQPTHFVDFEQIKLQPYSLLFIDKDRVHQFDQLLNYEGRVSLPIFIVEAKRLPAPKKENMIEYVKGQKNNGGIERFKTGKHGVAQT